MNDDDFHSLIQTHRLLIHKVVSVYCRNPSDRDDVTQEILTQLWLSRGRIGGRERPALWVYRVALNVAISFYRRERRHVERRDELPILVVERTEPDEMVEALGEAIRALPELDRALVLLYLEGEEYTAIGEVLGMTPTNVGTRLSRLKKRLRRALEVRSNTRSEHDA